eukprot:4652844-Karenia_brevis.AAC.1
MEDTTEEWQKSKSRIKRCSMEAVGVPGIKTDNKYEALQEADEDENEEASIESQKSKAKECSALFWEEVQELSPLVCGNEGEEWQLLTVTVDS